MQKNILPLFLLLATMLLKLSVQAQGDVKNEKLNIHIIPVHASFHYPGGDLADRFGESAAMGTGYLFKSKSDWILGVDANFIFGQKVKIEKDLLKNISTTSGGVIDKVGVYSNYVMYERGYHFNATVGKLFPVIGPNPNSGIMVTASAGYLWHRIRIDVENNTTPQLKDDYKYGYDRLTGGVSLSENLGYLHLSNNRKFNIYAGLEFIQAFTSPIRKRNFDLLPGEVDPDPSSRLDLFYGIRIGWMLPVYSRAPDKFYYY